MRITALLSLFLILLNLNFQVFSFFQVFDSHLFQNGFQKLEHKHGVKILEWELLPVTPKQVNLPICHMYANHVGWRTCLHRHSHSGPCGP